MFVSKKMKTFQKYLIPYFIDICTDLETYHMLKNTDLSI